MTTNKEKMQRLIERIVYESYTLSEQEETQDNDMGGNDSESAGGDADAAESDMGLDLDAAATDLGGETDDIGLDDADMGDEDFGAMGGGGGGFNLGGGGGGGASPFEDSLDTAGDEDTGDEEVASEAEPVFNALEPGESLLPEEPAKEILNVAIALRGETGNHQLILNSVKALIQDYFEKPEDAEEVIIALWQTDDSLLRVVARKLLLFIKGN